MKKSRPFILISVVVILAVFSVLLLFASEYYTSQPDFCGSCHIMKKPFKSWKDSEHNKVACVQCHYGPGEKQTLKAKFQSLSRLFSYLAAKEKEVKSRAWIQDASCTTSECHTPEKFLTKKVKFTEKIPYIHKTHEEKTIEGQKMHCNTCHLHVSEKKHFEVPKEVCFLCHFKNTRFNEGRGRCDLCHTIPTKPLQKHKTGKIPDEKPMTHKSLEKAKVPCYSCHYELVIGNGGIKTESCLDCHDAPETLRMAMDKRLMHQKHVAGQNANCFNCHEPIQHEQIIQFINPILENCSTCHPDHHIYQKKLLTGSISKDVSETPGLMFDVKTNCLGCHTSLDHDRKGQKVLKATAESCVSCHTKRHKKMLNKWKDTLREEIEYVKGVEEEAKDAIARAEGIVQRKKIKKAADMLKHAQENLRIVEYGNGVHNKKYAIILIDEAVDTFEDLIDYLEEGR